jgi:hypothetical protein
VQAARSIDQEDIAKAFLGLFQSLLAKDYRGDPWIGIMNREF